MGTSVKLTQVKVSVDPAIASAFKKACETSNVSMASELSLFMANYAGGAVKRKEAADYSTRRRRRAAVKDIIQRLDQMRVWEEKVRDNTPDSLQSADAYTTTEEVISAFETAIDNLKEIYEE